VNENEWDPSPLRRSNAGLSRLVLLETFLRRFLNVCLSLTDESSQGNSNNETGVTGNVQYVLGLVENRLPALENRKRNLFLDAICH